MKIAISTSSFGVFDQAPLNLLQSNSLEVIQNDKGRTLNEQESISLLNGCVGIIAGTEPLTAQVMKASPSLKVISRCGVGVDSVDLEAAKARNIKVFTTPKAPTQAVAELTLGLCLSLLRNIVTGHADIITGQWQKRGGFSLHGKRVGIVGLGRIGLRVAQIFEALNAEIAYYDIEEKDEGYNFMPLHDLIAWANVITLHCPLGLQKRALIGPRELKLMQGKWLINTARGGLVDEKALYEHLHDKHIMGAALDVFQNEPYAGPLTKLDNVILSPHCAAFARESRIAMEMEATINLLNALG